MMSLENEDSSYLNSLLTIWVSVRGLHPRFTLRLLPSPLFLIEQGGRYARIKSRVLVCSSQLLGLRADLALHLLKRSSRLFDPVNWHLGGREDLSVFEAYLASNCSRRRRLVLTSRFYSTMSCYWIDLTLSVTKANSIHISLISFYLTRV